MQSITESSKVDFLVCHKCGKAILTVNKLRKYWLVRKDDNYNVVRCPFHITEWALRKAGIARTKKNIDWMMKCREEAEKLETMFVI